MDWLRDQLNNSHLILLFIGFTFAIAIWTLLYRLVFHPLAKIPGPLLPRLTALYEAYYDIYHHGKYCFQIAKLHKTHGPIIRPVPDEVHINDPDFLDTIYALRGRNNPNETGLFVEESVAGAEAFYLHKLRRDALNPFFTSRAVLGMEEQIEEKLAKVVDYLSEGLSGGSKVDVLNLSDIYFAFANDVVRNCCFGHDNNLLDDLDEAAKQRVSLMRLLTGVKINKYFDFFGKLLGKVLPPSLRKKTIPPAVLDLLAFKAQARQDIEAVLADTADEKRASDGGRKSVFYELRDNPDLPPEEKEVSRLEDEATILVMAGTESLAKSLQYASFYLLQNETALRRLKAELNSATNTNGNKLEPSTLLGLEYLNAVIMETNRLTFGVTNRMLRYSPIETLTYTASSGPHKGTTYTLPPRTKMSCLSYCAHTNEEIFPDPLRFDPDRFIGSGEEVTRRKKTLMALGKGHRRCLGMNLANAGMAMVISRFVEMVLPAEREGNDEVKMELFETEYEDVAFLHDYQIAHPRLDTKGIRVRARREMSG